MSTENPTYKINQGVPIPETAYEVGTMATGGRRAKFPFRQLDVGESSDIPLKPPLERAKHRGQIMAAIRSTIARYPGRRFRVEEVERPIPQTPVLRVWRFK